MVATFPHRTDRVDDMAYRWVQVERGRGHRLARCAGCQRGTRPGQSRPGRPMDRPVHPAAAQQRLVRRGDDGVDVLAGDVTERNFDHRDGPMMPPGAPWCGLTSPLSPVASDRSSMLPRPGRGQVDASRIIRPTTGDGAARPVG
ncbi:hypothetical protein A6A27_28110 [Micromonospora sp. CB01531]|nr:hypothetical protein A6A27_28110 [Micromonospora sp. CB01531]